MKPPANTKVEYSDILVDPKLTHCNFQLQCRDGSEKVVTIRQEDFPIHNDMNLWKLDETKYQVLDWVAEAKFRHIFLQGGLCLSPCPRGHGGFRCIPGFHKLARIREYRRRWQAGELHPPSTGKPRLQMSPRWTIEQVSMDRSHLRAEILYSWLDKVKIVLTSWQWRFDNYFAVGSLSTQVEMQPGDFVIWNSRLPHSNCVNKSPEFRLQCYVRYLPASLHPEYAAEVITAMIQYSCWLFPPEVAESTALRERPVHYSSGGFTSAARRDLEVNTPPANLTPLGKRLHGLK
jgi:hypothetical protein